MEKRGGLYNSRANLPMAGEILSGGKRIVFMPYGDLWKWERKVVHEILGPAKKEMFAPYQDTESRALLYEYLTQPDKWHLSNARYSSSVIMSVVFGRRTKLNDENVARIVQANDELTKVFEPGSNLIDAFPFLGRIPLPKSIQPWRWWGDAQYEQTRKNFRQEFEGLEQRQRQGKAQDCFVSEFLKLERDKRIDWDTMIFLAGSVIEAGSDTTRVSLSQILAAAALFPDWVERARKQIDEVCGANAERLPVAGDAPRMPLVKAAAKEAVRWNPSFGDIAHSLTQDDEFEGHRFPAGTIFSWNHWGIHNDPKVYDQPERFWPERFLNEDLDKPTKGHFGFGAGTLACFPVWCKRG
ncbi:Cytochrome P450 [Macrophomina phaseolina MS6]|uniref:Cytochrome P450 n=1 Tax=Macrophomina phaseolina (strain MS6) TaxID=1126212 RepID=K2QWP6_MACPH|nr:Cytochrome P450 [Macrophomina phaseolina MS6]